MMAQMTGASCVCVSQAKALCLPHQRSHAEALFSCSCRRALHEGLVEVRALHMCTLRNSASIPCKMLVTTCNYHV